MLNLPRLSRLVVAGEFDRILQEVSRNGRPLPLGVRLRLSEPAGAPSAAMGLALRRVCELTYRPTSLGVTLARALVDRCDAEGSFGTLASTSIAVAGLLAFVDQISILKSETAAERFGVEPELAAAARRSIDSGLHRLHRAQEESSAGRLGEPPALIGDELDSAIALWQLGLEPRFTRVVRFADLLAAVDDRGLRHERATAPLLCRLDEPEVKERGATERTNRSAA